MGKAKYSYKSYLKPGSLIPMRTLRRVKKRLRAEPSEDHISTIQSLPVLQLKQLNEELESHPDNGNEAPQMFESVLPNVAPPLPLFDGSQVTKSELVILLFGFMMKYQLTHEAMNDLMKILSRIIPFTADFPKTFLRLLSIIPMSNRRSSIHFYCPTCEANLQPGEDEITCKSCKIKYSKALLESSSSFYVMFNMKTSIESILEDQEVANELMLALASRSNETEFLRDICDGEAYRNLNLSPFDITLSMNTDGVALYKSSKLSLWPILLSMNELHYKTRYKNTFVGGLWVGSKKPNFDAFFETFSIQCCDLSNCGVKWRHEEKEITSKVYFPIMVCDSVARCLCQGIHQFNGNFGCTWCLNQGKSLSYGESSRKWIYEGTHYDARDHCQFLGHIRELCTKVDFNKNASHFGVTTASQLLSIPKFDIVSGFTYDVMHSAFLGIAKSMLIWWTSSEHHDRPFYIGRKLKEIDKNLLSFCVPFCFDRNVRSVTILKFWKASEWRTWTFVALIVLKNILPQQYLNHFSYFVEAIILLSGSAIHKTEVVKSEELIKLFVQGLPNLYGLEFCLYNFHILLHAPACVRNWGPLWCYSAFQFESWNGKLGRLLNGHRRIDVELANKCDLVAAITSAYRNVKASPNIDLGLSLLFNRKKYQFSREVGCVRYIGPQRLYFFTKAEQAIINRQVGATCKRAFSFKKCSVNGVIYTTSHEKSLKRRNCIAECDSLFYEISNIFEAEGHAFAFCRRLRVRPHANQSSAFTVAGISPAITVLPLQSFLSKFICGKQNPQRGQFTSKYIVKLPNTLENE